MTPTERFGIHRLAAYSHRGEAAEGGRSGTGPGRVVLVHGTMDRASSLAKVARRLRDIDVIRYDRRGYGESTTSEVAESVDQHVTDLIDVLDDRPACVIGHSIGGTIALAGAQRRPDLLVAVGVYEAPRPWAERPSDPSAAAAEPSAADAAERFMREMIGDAAWERMPTASRDRRRSEGPALLADMRSMRQGPVYDARSIAVPITAAHGSLSNPRHVTATTELVASASLGGPMIIDGAAHGAHLTHPDAFADLVRAVLASVPVTRPRRDISFEHV